MKATSLENAQTLVDTGFYEYADPNSPSLNLVEVKNPFTGDKTPPQTGSFEQALGNLQGDKQPYQEAFAAADKQEARLKELFDPAAMESQAQQTAGNVARKLAVAGAAGAGRPMGQAGIQAVANAATQSLAQQKKDWVVAETQAFGQVMSARLQAAGLMNQDRADKTTEMMATLQYLEANEIIDSEAEARRVGQMLMQMVINPDVAPGQMMTLAISYSD